MWARLAFSCWDDVIPALQAPVLDSGSSSAVATDVPGREQRTFTVQGELKSTPDIVVRSEDFRIIIAQEVLW